MDATVIARICTLLAIALTTACTFDAAKLADKSGCRTSGDCTGAHVCACGVCTTPSLAPAVCGDDVGVDVTDAGDDTTTDVAEDASADADAPDAPDACESNPCGGCSALPMNPADSCGECADGIVVCVTPDTVECFGASSLNACGGCGDLANEPGSSCGDCLLGTWECEDGAVVCTVPDGRNTCGGCLPLQGEPGSACGTCGRGSYICDGDRVTCIGDEFNVCGGCAVLEENPGDSCGICGLGTLSCAEDLEALDCSEPDGTNGCGGCTTLAETLGDACGVCGDGEIVCDGTDATMCMGGEMNACDGCGDLAGEPGASCGCGPEAWICVSATEVACVDGLGEAANPIDLGDWDDTASWQTHMNVLHDAAEEDWFELRVDDTPGATLIPEFTLDAQRDYALCAFYTWDDDTGDPTFDCGAGAPVNLFGLVGCCSDNSGLDQEFVRFDNLDRPEDDDGTALIYVFSNTAGATCQPYTLRFKL